MRWKSCSSRLMAFLAPLSSVGLPVRPFGEFRRDSAVVTVEHPATRSRMGKGFEREDCVVEVRVRLAVIAKRFLLLLSIPVLMAGDEVSGLDFSKGGMSYLVLYGFRKRIVGVLCHRCGRWRDQQA